MKMEAIVLCYLKNEFVRHLVTKSLYSQGMKVIQAETSDSAREYFLENSVQLVVVEENWNGEMGYDSLNFARKISSVPFIIISYETMEEVDNELLNFQILTHPFSEAKFLQKSLRVKELEGSGKRFTLEGGQYVQTKEELIPLDLKDYFCGRETRFRIYLKTGHGKYAVLEKGSEYFTDQEVDALLARGVEQIYLRKDDFIHYISMSVDLLSKIHRLNLSGERKLSILNSVSKLMIQTMTLPEISNDTLKRAKRMFDSLTVF